MKSHMNSGSACKVLWGLAWKVFFFEAQLKNKRHKLNNASVDTHVLCIINFQLKLQLTLSLISTHFIACVTSVDPDQLAHPCFLIGICTVRFLVRNNLINKKVNSMDTGQTACIKAYIWRKGLNKTYEDPKNNILYSFSLY
jgi:hypothetical protein